MQTRVMNSDLSPKTRDSMSRSLTKQSSLESPGAGYGRRRALEGEAEDDGHRGKLNRSMTIAGRNGTASRASRDSLSPLKRFGHAKEAIRKAFHHLSERLEESQLFMQTARKGEMCGAVSSLTQRTRGIQDILSRDHMKVAFFGRTSNGKSSVINALLHGKVLPVGIGHTTNCFCSVVGVDGGDGYLLTGDSQERKGIKSLQQLAHSLSRQHLDPSALVRIFWPKTKCPLLAEDVEFVDSPGVDMNPNMDEWITKHCLDADVFVLVSNAESTLMNAEKSFFHRVSERLSKPNIFILNNRWDASDMAEVEEEEELEGSEENIDGLDVPYGSKMMEQVMQQHMERDVKFLAEELRVTDEQTARHRVFFVSAKEVLHYRMKKLQNSPAPGQGLAPGHKARLQNFEEFEMKFKECLSNSAIQTKFEQHYKQGLSVVQELEGVLGEEERRIQTESQQVSYNLQASRRRHDLLRSEGPAVRAKSDQLISQTVEEVEQAVAVAMSDILSLLPTTVDNYKANFDPTQLAAYKSGLFHFMDSHLVEEVGRVGTSTLGKVYEEAQAKLIDYYQALLQLQNGELARINQLVRAPELTYVLRCSDLCEDFQEDLQFHFSLGLNTLLTTVNAGSWVRSLQTQLARMQSIISLEYGVPILLVVVAVLLPRFLSWRVVVPALALYGGVYSYEWLSWTSFSKESALKRQFVQYMKDKVQYQVKATSKSYVFQLRANLDLLKSHLHQQLQNSQSESQQDITSLSHQVEMFTALQNRLKTVRNAVQLSRRDLDRFSEDYLKK